MCLQFLHELSIRDELENVLVTQPLYCDHVCISANLITKAQPCRHLTQLAKIPLGSRHVLVVQMLRACTVRHTYGIGQLKASIPGAMNYY